MSLPVPVRVRRPVLAVGSVAVIAASVAIFVSIYSGATRQVPVLTVVRPVAQGGRIVASDLGEVDISTSGALATVPVTRAGEVIGKTAAVALLPGSLFTMSDISDAAVIPAGEAIVGIALKEGRLPAAGLQPGDQVMVVQTDPPGVAVSAGSTTTTGSPMPFGAAAPAAGGDPAGAVLVSDALVHDVALPSVNGGGSATQLVSIELALKLAASVSVAAAADQVSLVLLPTRGAGG